jgi:hypothetical protein
MAKGWIGVDLDATLAIYTHWRKDGSIGAPVPKMVTRVKKWLEAGEDVRIFTARVCGPDPNASKEEIAKNEKEVKEQYALIEAWCLKHIGQVLPITNKKDLKMRELWDDRAVQVTPNTGEPIDPKRKEE